MTKSLKEGAAVSSGYCFIAGGRGYYSHVGQTGQMGTAQGLKPEENLSYGGLCGLRMAIELGLLGCNVIIKGDTFSRNYVLYSTCGPWLHIRVHIMVHKPWNPWCYVLWQFRCYRVLQTVFLLELETTVYCRVSDFYRLYEQFYSSLKAAVSMWKAMAVLRGAPKWPGPPLKTHSPPLWSHQIAHCPPGQHKCHLRCIQFLNYGLGQIICHPLPPLLPPWRDN